MRERRPIAVRWDEQALDLRDPQGRFRRSEWNYFLVDREARVLMGYWLAEGGVEELGGDDFDEVLHVIEGALYVTCAGQEYTAGLGDTVVVRRGRPMRIEVRELTRVFFVCYPMEDPEGYEAGVRRTTAEKGL